MKKTWIAVTAAVSLGLLVARSSGTVVFQDNFQSGAQWVKASWSGDITASVENGTYTVDNASEFIGGVQHDLAGESTFTYSVDMTVLSEAYSYVGIYFCGKPGLKGYLFTIHDQQGYTIAKFADTTTIELGSGRNSFVNPKSNVLKVSKSGNRMNFFCNGAYLTTIEDDSYASGNIGLVVGSGQKVAYNQAVYTDEYVTGNPKSRFSDDFEDGDIQGWLTWRLGHQSIRESDGVLSFTAGEAGSRSIIVTSGMYENAPVRVIAKRTGGNVDGFYGLIAMQIRDTVLQSGENGTTFSSFVAQISGSRNRVAYVFQPGYIEYSSVPASAISPEDTDTLEFTSDYQFVVNGSVLPDIDYGTQYPFNAVGFIVDSDVSVEFDMFQAGAPSEIRLAEPSALIPDKPVYTLGGPGIIYDPRGRRMPSEATEFGRDASNGGRGVYFVVPEGEERNRVGRKAIIIR